jgi:hypothetical protein
MWKDPVVEEVRAIRDEYAKKFNYDLVEICHDIREQEVKSNRELVTLPPRRVKSKRKANAA